MSAEELGALSALTFNWTRSLEDVWRPSPYHVEGLHTETAELIRRSIEEARASRGSNPLGIAIQGERGVGKTHLLGWTREQVELVGGYFFLVTINSKSTFWEEVVGAFVERLQPHQDGSRNQLEALLTDLTDRTGLEGKVRDAILGRTPPSRDDLNAFVAGLRRMDRFVGMTCQDTARALVLLASPDPDHQDVGYDFLTDGDIDLEVRRGWGIRSRPKTTRFMITELSRLLALSGPTVVAVDQIDALIEEIGKTPETDAPGPERQVTEVASGLMALRDLTYRTLTIISCLPRSWDYITKNTIDTVTDRFRPATQLQNIPSPDIGYTMIERRFAVEFAEVGFHPPYPTWPIRESAFEDARRYTARRLLRRIEAHVNRCLHEGTVVELERLDEQADVRAAGQQLTDSGLGRTTLVEQADWASLDTAFDELHASADVSRAFDPKTEDATVPRLMAAGLDCWIRERGEDAHEFSLDRPTGRNPALHGSLLLTVNERTERQQKWAFRAINADNAKAVLNRLRTAMAKAGLDGENTERQLFVLRNIHWPTGPTSDRETAEFADKGGVSIAVTADDFKVFAALDTMLSGRHPSLNAWLVARQPAHQTELLGRTLRKVPAPNESRTEPAPVLPQSAPQPQERSEPPSGPSIRIGRTTVGQAIVHLNLASLRRHMAIFAGTGSGKTVLLRRVVEECALHGVSSIVLDPNNDLARLGDPWPTAQQNWLEGDAERAHQYFADTDVKVWTPRRQGGRPLTFQPLPTFADVLDDEDEFQAAVDSAIEAIAPQVSAHKTSDKARVEKAVLTEALRYFARNGGHDLSDFIALLAALPIETSTLSRASAIAAELANRLEAARVNDPLFGGAGHAADPGMLLTPSPGKRARISVISLIGLPSEDQRQSFVNQLQMALFSWVKKHPAGDRPLGGLFVMDEAQMLAPSLGTTVCTQSTLRLASQARKYGLGLLFATQSPRGLHNQIAGNATTQFYGLLNSPTQIDSARELARAKGGDVPDISRLETGQFYLATEGQGFRQVRTPMCLSYHPASPLTEEEVIIRARR